VIFVCQEHVLVQIRIVNVLAEMHFDVFVKNNIWLLIKLIVVCENEFFFKKMKMFLVRVINASIDDGCASCIQRNGICLDENFDDHMDKCFCPIDNDLCNDRSTAYLLPVTQSLRKM
jgi:hypothetical protein